MISNNIIKSSTIGDTSRFIFAAEMTDTKWDELEELVNNIDQYLGKPRHIYNVGRSEIAYKIKQQRMFVRVKGTEIVREMVFEEICKFFKDQES